ncbi:MAG: hypothetical protein Q9199_007477 [Rusavskia elegans]
MAFSSTSAALLLSTFICFLISATLLRRRYSNEPSHVDHVDQPRACKQYGSSPQPPIESWRSILIPKSWKKWHLYPRKQGPVVGLVNSLYVHPIKSCRAVRVEEAEVLSTGLKYDRSFTFAELLDHEGKLDMNSSESTNWMFVTQRKYRLLANIRLEIWVPDPESPDYSPDQANVMSEGILRVRYPDPKSDSPTTAFKMFDIPYSPTEDQVSEMGYTKEKLTIWKDRPDVLLIASTTNASPPEWIKEIQSYIRCLKPLALFRVAAGHERQVFRNAPSKEQLGYQSVVGFVDAYPLHILGLSSVANLDQRLASVVPEFKESSALRFRANIYCDGPEAYAEDSWKRIRIGQSMYYVACRTTRCELPNTNQRTGVKHQSQPSKLMKTYRNIDEGAGLGKACMGMQMVPATERGIIKVGDEIEVLETGAHYYIKQ